MTTLSKNEVNSKIVQFNHVKFWVSNAKLSAYSYCTLFGFEPFAYKGLETGSREVVTIAIRQNNIVFIFETALLPDNEEIGEHILKHGDGVRDIAFEVDNIKWIIEHAKKEGAKIVTDITTESDKNGSIKYASIQTYGDTIHTLIEKKNYNGNFLPNFKPYNFGKEFFESLPKVKLNFIDHCVGNQPNMQMEPVVQWYEKVLLFHRFWSVDDSIIHTKYSALRSVVLTNKEESIKLPINEPAQGKKAVSQIQEFVDYYGGAGVQHIALNTSNIINAITALKARGVEFLTIPNTYYEDLHQRLKKAHFKINEDLEILQKLQILVDFDEKGYLLQIFSKPCQDRPTLFIEIIQRNNHQGFGAGNFKALFESIELEQKERGNLFYKNIKIGSKNNELTD